MPFECTCRCCLDLQPKLSICPKPTCNTPHPNLFLQTHPEIPTRTHMLNASPASTEVLLFSCRGSKDGTNVSILRMTCLTARMQYPLFVRCLGPSSLPSCRSWAWAASGRSFSGATRTRGSCQRSRLSAAGISWAGGPCSKAEASLKCMEKA